MSVVVDLNVMRTAWTSINPYDAWDIDATVLLAQIVKKCHKFFVTKEIDTLYRHLFDQLRLAYPHGPDSLNVVKLYFQAKIYGKVDETRRSAELPSLPDESGIKDEDREFARLANLTGSILVTYDDPLILVLDSLGVSAMTPKEAITVLNL